MTRRRFAFARWRLDPTGAPLVRTMVCRQCPEKSGPSADLMATGHWGARHAGLTGHTELEEVTVAPLRAALIDAPAGAGVSG